MATTEPDLGVTLTQPTPQVFTIQQAQSTTRRQKARNRRDVWKDQTGSSILEMDSSSSVKVVCGTASSKTKSKPID